MPKLKSPYNVLSSDPYKALAMAIVRQAVVDYHSALEGPNIAHGSSRHAIRRAEIERFFHSRWFETLCDLDADELLDMIRTIPIQGDAKR